jgi:hypothetical protein
MPPKSIRVPTTCTVCGRVFTVYPNRASTAKYCSNPCRYAGYRTHGNTSVRGRAREYTAWTNMKIRCLNPRAQNYALYGGRGITVCDRWRDSFEHFLADVGRRPSPLHSVDRIDPNGNYEPSNVRWSTVKEQAQNRRTTRLIAFNGTTLCLNEWVLRTGIDKVTLSDRLNRGWSVERALTTPTRAHRVSTTTRPTIAPIAPRPAKI